MTDNVGIYEAIAAALAEGREPDLSPFDPEQVRTALERVLQFPVPRQNFLSWLNSRVQQLSDGRVSIEERTATTEPESTGPQPAPDVVPELPVRILVQGEPFAEPAVVRADPQVLRFPMRDGQP